MAESAIRWWASLTSDDARALLARDPVVVFPIGSTEQHGPHLPLSTDLDIGLGLLEAAFRALPSDFPACALPPQALGSSREHGRFAGTLSLEPELLGALVEEVGDALASAGVRRLVLANSHGGNRHLLEDAGLRLRDEHRMLVVKATWFRFPRPEGVDLPEEEWRHGFHGGAVETAMMLHLRPDLVRQDRARAAPSLGAELERDLTHVRPEGAASFAWLAGDLNPSGVVGDARRADARMGARLVEHYGSVLAQVIRDARAFPLDRLA
jgi:creatinine amidohydrolase